MRHQPCEQIKPMFNYVPGRYSVPFIFVTVAILTLLLSDGEPEAATRLGVLEAVVGEVSIKRLGVEKHIRTSVGTPVLIGDMVITGSGARAQVILSSGAFVNLSSSTRIRFNHYTLNATAYKSKLFTRILGGVARFVTIGGSPVDTRCIVETETAVISAGNVDIVVSNNDKSTTQVFSLAGRISVKNNSNLVVGRVILTSGTTTSVSGNEPPLRPESFSIARRRALKKETAISVEPFGK